MQHYSLKDLDAVDSKEWTAGTQKARICPNCGQGEKHRKERAVFRYDPNTGKYECKRNCGAKGTLIDYWTTIARCPYCDTRAEGLLRSEIWNRWKADGKNPDHYKRTKDAADQVIGLHLDDSGAWRCRSCNASGQLRNYTGRGSAGRGSYKELRAEAERREKQAAQDKVKAALSALTQGGPKPSDGESNCKWLSLWEEAHAVQIGSGSEYVQSRGITHDAATHGDVRFHPAWGKAEKWKGAPAVLFPLRDRKGNLQAVFGRYIKPFPDDPETGKPWRAGHQAYGQKSQGVFLSAPGGWKADVIAVTESGFKALAFTQATGIAAIGTGGTSWPDWLPMALIFKRVLLASDADEAGDKMADGLADELAPFTRRVERVRPSGAKDWDEMLVGLGEGSICSTLPDDLQVIKIAETAESPQRRQFDDDPREAPDAPQRLPAPTGWGGTVKAPTIRGGIGVYFKPGEADTFEDGSAKPF